MSDTVLGAVPNFSQGHDLEVVEEIAAEIETVSGVEVVDRTSDPDHHRRVLTILGPPEGVGEATLHAARAAAERIDLRNHIGVHPRSGALDVAAIDSLKVGSRISFHPSGRTLGFTPTAGAVCLGVRPLSRLGCSAGPGSGAGPSAEWDGGCG